MKRIYISTLALLVCLFGYFYVKAFYVPPDSEKIKITVSTDGAVDDELKSLNKRVEEFEKKNPDIDIELYDYSYYMDYFDAAAINKSVPMYFSTWFSQMERMIKNGFAADLTEYLTEKEYIDKMAPEIKNVICYNERIYGIPQTVYAMGMTLSEPLFREAGLVDDDGNVLVPQDFDSVWRYARIIREKTGKPGYAIRTDSNSAGWQLCNVAWNYGVEFIREENGIMKSSFDDDRLCDILNEIYHLKWDYDAIYYDRRVNPKGGNDIDSHEVGMTVASPESGWGVAAGRDEEVIYFQMPRGDGGRYALTGGTIKIISSYATPEQIEACIKWAEFNDELPARLTKETKQKWIGQLSEWQGCEILRVPYVWKNEKERTDVIESLVKKYGSEDDVRVRYYNNFDDTELKTEVSVNCQKLYEILGKCIDEVMTNKDVDIKAIVHEANEKFQNEYLN